MGDVQQEVDYTWACSECGGTDVHTEATIEWETPTQSWVVIDFSEADFVDWCTDCQDHHQLHRRPLNLKEIAQVAIYKAQAA